MIVEAAEQLGRLAAEAAQQIEDTQLLPAALRDAMRDAGLFQMYVRPAVGGPGADPLTAYLAVEALARGDASTGWLSMVSSTTAWLTGFLTDDVLGEMVGSPCDLRIAGSSKPLGTAQRAPGGYRVSGRWDFASGIMHANWVMAGCRIVDPRPGEPEIRMMFVPIRDVRVDHTWAVVGTRGTGSHDMYLDDVFVADEFSAAPVGEAIDRSPLYSQRILRIATHGPVAAVAVGLAQGAIADLLALAEQATSLNSTRLRDRAEAQRVLADATARIGAARGYTVDSIARAWDAVCNGCDPARPVAEARLSFAHASREAGRVIDAIVDIVGTPMVHISSPLQRRLRDYNVVRHFPSFDVAIHENAGRVLFGLEPEGSGW